MKVKVKQLTCLEQFSRFVFILVCVAKVGHKKFIPLGKLAEKELLHSAALTGLYPNCFIDLRNCSFFSEMFYSVE